MFKIINFFQCFVLFGSLLIMISCTEPRPDLPEQLNHLVQEKKAVGLAVAVVKEGEIIYEDNFGYSDLENETPLEKGDLFRIASISKSFTSSALLQLIEKDSLHLEDDVSDLVGFKVRNPKFPDTPITLKMILSHSSSLNDSQGYFTLNTINPDSTDTWQKSYNDYEPGTSYEYCNLNYNLAGTILERQAEIRFDDYIIDHILKPLQLNGGYDVDRLDRSKFVNLYDYHSDTGELKHSPEAYQSRSEALAHYKMGYDTPVFSPTGGMKISAHDLARYMAMHMNFGELDGVRVLEEESDRTIQNPVIKITDEAAYGLAIFTVKNLIENKTMVGHTGSAYGLYSSMFFIPDENIGFVAITNGVEEGEPVEHEYSSLLKESINLLYRHFKSEEASSGQ